MKRFMLWKCEFCVKDEPGTKGINCRPPLL